MKVIQYPTNSMQLFSLYFREFKFQYDIIDCSMDNTCIVLYCLLNQTLYVYLFRDFNVVFIGNMVYCSK